MAHRVGDRVFETCTGTSGNITTTGAVGGGYQTLAAVLTSNSDTADAVIWSEDNSQWEATRITRVDATTYSRATPYASSNSGSAVSFTAGTKLIWLGTPARFLDFLNTVEIDVASATTCDIGAVQGSRVNITGTTTITSFGTSTHKLRFVRFAGALILTHNATSLILPGAANITTAAGDTAICASDSSGNWRCVDYRAAASAPVGTTGTLTHKGPVDLSAAGAGQIAFPATQNASAGANILDDYEEGTWTPSVGGTATYTTQVGRYTKIGRNVLVELYVQINSIGTGSTTTLSGLPFANNGTLFGAGPAPYFTGIVDTISSATLFISTGATTAAFTGIGAAAGSSATTHTVFKNSTLVSAAATYSV